MTTPMSDERLAEIRAALDSVPAGPWWWRMDCGSPDLMTQHSGWQYLLGSEATVRSDGEPQDDIVVRTERLDRQRRRVSIMRSSRELGVEFKANPVAAWVAQSPTLVADLLAEVDRLRALVSADPPTYGEWFGAMLADAEARGSHLPVGQAWHQVHPERHERIVDGVLWALDDLDETEIGPDDPGPGWYLYGPGAYREGRFVSADSDSVPVLAADAAITAARAAEAVVGTCDGCGRPDQPRQMYPGAWMCVDTAACSVAGGGDA